MTVPTKMVFMELALDHLGMITADTAMPEIRLHCHFARTFLELALGENHWGSASPMAYMPSVEYRQR